MSRSHMKVLFLVAGLYDVSIGGAFLFFGPQLLKATGVGLPDHWAYLQFAACELIIFGLMFLSISRDPVAHRHLIPFGLLLKASYFSLATYYFSIGQCPLLFQPFAVIDALMFVLFVVAYQKLGSDHTASALPKQGQSR